MVQVIFLRITILYFLRKISSIDFYLKNIKREGGLLKQEIYLWKSLFGK